MLLSWSLFAFAALGVVLGAVAGALLLFTSLGSIALRVPADGTVFSYGWFSCLLLVLSIVGAGILAVVCFNCSFLFSGRIAALSGMFSFVLALLVAPGWFVNKVELRSDTVSFRYMHNVTMKRVEARWENIASIIEYPGTVRLHTKRDGPIVVELDGDTVRAISPELRRVAEVRGIHYQR